MTITLGDRLRQVVARTVPRVQPDAAAGEPTALPKLAPCRPMDGLRVANALAGQWVDSPDGAVVIVDRYYGAHRCHGRERIGAIVDTLEAGAESLNVLARAWPGRDAGSYAAQLCFFDLETTGLAGGAGTQAFLVGSAVIEDGGLRVRQFLLPGFEHERALLGMVARWTASHATLVSFNGRSFDAPLIETRYLLHRLS